MKKSTLTFLLTFFISAYQLGNVSVSQGRYENSTWKQKEGLELIGTKAPSFDDLKWLNYEPIDIDDLYGKVVLIRFWLVGCPLCEHTAPALVELYNKYKDDGFIIVGIHHPKSQETRDPDLVRRAMDVFGFDFPVAQDNDWKVINAYWLKGENRLYTSVSFLIDKKGVIRFIHDGGEFYKSEDNPDANNAYLAIEKKIQELLKE